MKISKKRYDDIIVLALSGTLLSDGDASRVRDTVYKLLDDNTKKIVIDIQRVTHMNSTGLGAIVASLTSARNRQGDLRIAGTNEKIGPLLTVTKLVRVFKVYETVDRAVASFT
jgi:anti-sigma B factor antagonist